MHKNPHSNLIRSLEAYRNGQLSGEQLLALWENSTPEFQYIYYNLCHLVADEDIRKKDEKYHNMQMHQLSELISGLNNGESIENLKQISFLSA